MGARVGGWTLGLALGAFADGSEKREGVEAGRVRILECDLKRVLADERDILHPQLIRFEALEPSQTSGYSSLAATLRTRAGPSKSLARVAASMPVLPGDDHHLALAIDGDPERRRVRVFQGRAYRTLMTGSWRN